MRLFGIIVLIAGTSLFTLATFIVFGRIGLLHEYHYNNVLKKDFKKFTLLIGFSLMFGGIGMMSSGIVSTIYNDESIATLAMILLLVPLAISIISTLITIKHYNHSIFE